METNIGIDLIDAFMAVPDSSYDIPSPRTCGAAANVGKNELFWLGKNHKLSQGIEWRGKSHWFGVWNYGRGALPPKYAAAEKFMTRICEVRDSLVPGATVVDKETVAKPWKRTGQAVRAVAAPPAEHPQHEEKGCTIY